MNWENLKEERCPKCGAFLKKDKMYLCEFCNFRMNFGKVYSLVGKVGLEVMATELLRRRK